MYLRYPNPKSSRNSCRPTFQRGFDKNADGVFRDVKLLMNEKEWKGVSALHGMVPFTYPKGTIQRQEKSLKYINTFLRSDTPPPTDEQLQEMSPPVFPRFRRLTPKELSEKEGPRGEKKVAGAIGCLRNTNSFLQLVEIPRIDPDLAEANMAIVSGWSMYYPINAYMLSD